MTNADNPLQDIGEAVGCCLLCGSRPAYVGCFIPDEPERWPGPPLRGGKRRTIWYGLCERCRQRPNLADVVEAELAAAHKAQQAVWN